MFKWIKEKLEYHRSWVSLYKNTTCIFMDETYNDKSYTNFEYNLKSKEIRENVWGFGDAYYTYTIEGKCEIIRKKIKEGILKYDK